MKREKERERECVSECLRVLVYSMKPTSEKGEQNGSSDQSACVCLDVVLESW